MVKCVVGEWVLELGNGRKVLVLAVEVGRAVPLAGREPQLFSHVSECVAARSSRAELRKMPVTST